LVALFSYEESISEEPLAKPATFAGFYVLKRNYRACAALNRRQPDEAAACADQRSVRQAEKKAGDVIISPVMPMNTPAGAENLPFVFQVQTISASSHDIYWQV
jgi:hypothetical protein